VSVFLAKMTITRFICLRGRKGQKSK
jgi:hypothetical protein